MPCCGRSADERKGLVVRAAEVRHLLRIKYQARNGGVGMPEHLLLFEVPVDGRPAFPGVPGLEDRRMRQRIDAVAVGMWRKTEHLVHGFEIKVSRADLLAELRDPDKAAAGVAACDTWSLVLAPGLLRPDDVLPDGWGVLVAGKRALRWSQRPARRVGVQDARFNAGLLQASLRSHGACRGLVQIDAEAKAERRYRGRERDATAWRERLLADQQAEIDRLRLALGAATLGTAD